MRSRNPRFRTRQPRSGEEGFSIIEILVVFSVLAVAMIPLAAVQFSSRQEVGRAERLTGAAQLAYAQIETARAAGFGNAVNDTLMAAPYTAVTRVAADPVNPFLEEVQVTVSWTDRGGDRSITLAGKLARR